MVPISSSFACGAPIYKCFCAPAAWLKGLGLAAVQHLFSSLRGTYVSGPNPITSHATKETNVKTEEKKN